MPRPGQAYYRAVDTVVALEDKKMLLSELEKWFQDIEEGESGYWWRDEKWNWETALSALDKWLTEQKGGKHGRI